MTNRECLNNILHGQTYDRIPLIHMGFWTQTVEKWAQEGHISQEELSQLVVNGGIEDGSEAETALARRLGLEESYLNLIGQKGAYWDVPLYPPFEEKIVETYADGSFKKLNREGIYIAQRPGAMGIEAEMGHVLEDRESWEKHYLPRLQWSEDRVDMDEMRKLIAENDTREQFMGIFCGSLVGKLRNYWGLLELCYLEQDDPELYEECVETVGELCYQLTKYTLETGVKVDFAHFFEDVACKNGPLINPETFNRLTAKNYRRISDLCRSHGVDTVVVDCDGFIEHLVPTWLDNGVNVMFPIEYGAWQYDFRTMRKKFGKELLGIGNVNKHVLAEDRAAVDREIERIKAIVDVGGYVPCFDHRIAPEAEWDLVQYYSDKFKEAFWK